jgi:hypothetical protein
MPAMHPTNKYRMVVALCLLASTIAFWLSRLSINPPVAREPLQATPKPEAKYNIPHASVAIKQPFASTPMLGLSDPRWKQYEVKRKADPSWEWRTPIEFFGKVVDENNHAVPSADIEICWNGTADIYGGDGVGQRTLTSNPEGLFSITGVQGKMITVKVSKEGFHRHKESNMSSFEYSGFWEPNFIEPDRDNPIVFRLQKKREAEPTYHLDSRVIMKYPALETHIDLLSKPVQKAGPSDLFVRITRSPDAGDYKPFDWKIEIEGRNGSELAESEDEFMTLAPAEGYNAGFVREHKALRSSSWPKMRFYVCNKLRNFYAAVEIEAAAFYPYEGDPGAALFVKATINPNNSPNLEYDPEKDLRKMAK